MGGKALEWLEQDVKTVWFEINQIPTGKVVSLLCSWNI